MHTPPPKQTFEPHNRAPTQLTSRTEASGNTGAIPPTLERSNARVCKIGRTGARSAQFETQNRALTQLK
jgi:hypothetical protein